MEIFDAHVHIGAGNADESFLELQNLGIRRVISSPMVGALAGSAEDLLQGNREALELFHARPEFYYPAVTVHPGFPRESMRSLRQFADLGLVWAGEWLTYKSGIAFDRPEWEPFFRFCAEKEMVVQLHNHESVPVIASRYPELTIVASHLNPDVLPLLAGCDGVFVDISGMHGGLVRGTLTGTEKLFGTERLLFGTDYPGYDAEPFIVRCRRAFPVAGRRRIFSGNLRAIMEKRGVRF